MTSRGPPHNNSMHTETHLLRCDCEQEGAPEVNNFDGVKIPSLAQEKVLKLRRRRGKG